MNIKKRMTTVACFILLAGCANTAHYSGDSAAFGSNVLKKDVLSSIRNFNIALSGCRKIDSVQSTVVDQKLNAQGGVLLSIEVWQVSACGTTQAYNVKLTNDGQGGTFINTNQRLSE